MDHTRQEPLGLFFFKASLPGRQRGLFFPDPNPGVASLSFPRLRLDGRKGVKYERVISESLSLKATLAVARVVRPRTPSPGFMPGGPHIGKRPVSLTCSWEGQGTKGFSHLYSCHRKFQSPLLPGPSWVFPKLFSSLIQLQRALP